MSIDQAPTAVQDSAADRATARAERRLARLERLSDKGLAMAEALPEDGAPASAESFAKLSRAVRLTVTLEEKLDNALAARLAGEQPISQDARVRAAPPIKGVDPYATLLTGRRGRARELVVDVADHEIPDPDEHDILTDALDERLLCDQAYDHIEDLPLRDIVEHLCADLQLKPDWRRWSGEGWKPNPPFFRPLCSQFRQPSRRPVLDDPDPTPLE